MTYELNDARGQVLCLMSSHPNSREACAYIQSKVVNIVLIDDPNYNDKYDSIYNQVTVNPLEH